MSVKCWFVCIMDGVGHKWNKILKEGICGGYIPDVRVGVLLK